MEETLKHESDGVSKFTLLEENVVFFFFLFFSYSSPHNIGSALEEGRECLRLVLPVALSTREKGKQNTALAFPPPSSLGTHFRS